MGKYKWGDGSGPSARDRQTERESWKEERAAELDAAIRSLPEPYHWGSENFLEGNTRKSHSFFRDLQTVQQVKDYQLGTLAAFPGGDVDEAQQRLDQTATRSGLLAEQRALSASGYARRLSATNQRHSDSSAEVGWPSRGLAVSGD